LYTRLFRPHALRAEDRLLVWLLHTATDAVTLAATRAVLGEAIEWGRLIGLVEKHRIEVLIYLRLAACFSDVVPGDVMARLAKVYQAQQWHTLYMLSDMSKTLARLTAAGIAVMPLKGPVVALTVYENLYARRYKDIDLLIHQADLERATAVLVAEGYTLADWVDEPLKISSEFYESQHLTFVRLDMTHAAAVQIELHWSIPTGFDSFAHDSARLWGLARPIQTGGASAAGSTTGSFQFLGLPDEETLILLCIHGTKHMWMGLHWVSDIAAYLRRAERVEWGSLLAAAEVRRIKRLVLVSLLIAHHVYGAPLPAVVTAAAAADPLVDILARYNKSLIFHPEQGETVSGQMRAVWYHSLLREKWCDRLPYLSYVVRHRRSQAARRWVFVFLCLTVLLIFILLRL
jgi:hypothetical protein